MSKLTLYTYFRSSAAYRVRIALNIKGLDYQPNFIHLVKDGGQNNKPEYKKLNPQGMIPTLVVDDEVGEKTDPQVLTQSLAILEYLEEEYPNPPLLPATSVGRARVRSLAQIVTCDIHPLNNLRILEYLKKHAQFDEAKVLQWYQYWISEGFNALEQILQNCAHTQLYCYGDQPTLADVCLIPQIYNAVRFKCDLTRYPKIHKIYDNCMSVKSFIDAAPEEQPDSE